MEGLTQRQREILQFIVDTAERNGFPPTVREIGVHFEIKSTNGVNDHLKALERKGHLTRTGQLSRSLVATALGRRTLGLESEPGEGRPTLHLPLVRGLLPGTDLIDPLNVEDMLALDSALLPRTTAERFALRVQGDGMIDAGIFNGDILFAKRQKSARSGEIAVVLIDGDMAVRRVYPEGERIRLQPANDAMQPTFIDVSQSKGFEVLGIVIGLQRKFG
ncbi:MAG: transcriptional repressor LexA [Myxococcales bacterium]|jgi:repressor LexA|nr:transcriptional repressor LexA [Myxococcales bacterium]